MIDPLTPAECDLRDFPYLQIDVVRLFGSEFHALASDAAWRAGVTLWMKSWHQVPAGSLPDDDGQLARLAELGRDTKAFRKIKTEALRGWQQCSDGRLYHKVVAEKALGAWLDKLAQRLSSGAGNAKRWKIKFDPSEIEQQIDDAVGMLKAIDPASRRIAKAVRKRSQRDPDGTPERIPSGSQGEGEGSYTVGKPTAAVPIDEPSDDPGKSLFDQGTALLISKGRSETSSRSIIAKFQRDFGNPAVLDAIERCRGATDPVSAMRAHLGKSKAQSEYLGV